MSSATRPSPFLKLLLPLGVILMMGFAGIGFRYYNYEHHPRSIAEVLNPVSPEKTQITPNSIGVGLVVGNVYNFDAGQKTFDADGWLWVTWSTEVDKQLKGRGMTIQDLFFFFNGVNDYDFSLIPDTVAPLRMEGGRYYQKYRYSGHFYVNDLNFRLYPFQTLTLPIALELKSIPLLGEGMPLNLVLDHEHSGTGSYIEVAGYSNKGFTFSSLMHQYRNSHGEPGLVNDARTLCQARMEIFYGKAAMATVIKLFLPLLAVMSIILLSPMIPPTGWDVRLAIPPTITLTLIFLQQSYQTNLPELPYITFLDCLYNISYLYCLVLFGLYLWGSMEYHYAEEEDRLETILRIQKIDQYALISLIIFFPIASGINWYAMNLPWS